MADETHSQQVNHLHNPTRLETIQDVLLALSGSLQDPRSAGAFSAEALRHQAIVQAKSLQEESVQATSRSPLSIESIQRLNDQVAEERKAHMETKEHVKMLQSLLEICDAAFIRLGKSSRMEMSAGYSLSKLAQQVMSSYCYDIREARLQAQREEVVKKARLIHSLEQELLESNRQFCLSASLLGTELRRRECQVENSLKGILSCSSPDAEFVPLVLDLNAEGNGCEDLQRFHNGVEKRRGLVSDKIERSLRAEHVPGIRISSATDMPPAAGPSTR